MQFTTFTVFLAATSGLLSTAAAKDCYGTNTWCGSSLIAYGNYYSFVQNRLQAIGQSSDDTTIRTALWTCMPQGDIKFVSLCPAGCRSGGGKNTDDSCNTAPAMMIRGESEARSIPVVEGEPEQSGLH